uniref:WW domain-containing protein n=1 Tax=Pyrodinium bahamense TaxID=73915 RepID=A0A7R9ZWH6_9DINO|mmetsp:Transcript_12574/g.34708  ORF Transcript_12574/g.34708 Transcript_12574/m.34708 type:complete len:404 (+) Transcript_12574:115-1326(+)|eukprot:CAMPEP_0179054134 /NCGR_PEP_ID=MMETSP0796-20121207/22631_1 /TAXON_ID=73915 /ORGANISM="Pyrodinium bahamense, Strain pbaha01" /LENGTH=403 /DNA_ID=CAMNT_0020750751 /DNA_START=110 /DNA_END=1321 /DNA_ORIENTATION=+
MAGKGGGKGLNCNVKGMPKSSIDGLPSVGVAVFRESQDQAVEFCGKLREAMASYETGIHFDNIDVSTVQWPLMTFSLLLDVLQEKNATTKRFKAFKAGLDDDCIRLMAGWLEQLPAQSLPSEIHLSHNRITEEGFDALLTAIESKRSELTTQAAPIWLRVENNQVDIAPEGPVMKPLVDEGRVALVQKVNDRRPCAAAVAMPSFAGQQAGGGRESPALMALSTGAGAGKGATRWNQNTWDNKSGGSGGSGGAWKQDSWNRSENDWNGGNGDTAWRKRPGNGDSNATNTWWESKATGSWKEAANPWEQKQRQQHQATQQPQLQKQPQQQNPIKAAATRSGTAGSAGRVAQASGTADRSRTPPVRKGMAQAEPPLPPNWEKQWSDEYQIPYYWNNVTGESLWEPP